MKYIPEHFEQVLDHFKSFYDEDDPQHVLYFKHLCERFGLLIAVLNNLASKTESRVTSLDWFVGKAVEKGLLANFEISVSATKKLISDEKLINFLTLTFLSIYDENEDNYIESLINTVETLFEYYPENQNTCEYAMVEMMKSVAIKKVNVDNANQFISFFETLPRFYSVLDYNRIYELNALVKQTLGEHKPLDNEVFDQDGVKNKLVLLNYKLDMEDFYYEGLENV